MFALIILDKILLFDLTKHYGIYPIDEVNLDGYQLLLDYKQVLEHYKNNYFNNNLKSIERYSNFLFRICVSYLKDLSFA